MSTAQDHHRATARARVLREAGFVALPVKFENDDGPDVRRPSGASFMLRRAGRPELVIRESTAITRNGIEEREWVPEWSHVLWMHADQENTIIYLVAAFLARSVDQQRALLTVYALGGDDGLRVFVDQLAAIGGPASSTGSP